MRSKIKSWILSRTIWYHLRELGFQVSVPNLFSKAGTSTEETLKTTEAPETGETTSRPGKFISFDLKFNNMPPWYYIHVLYFNQQKYHSPQQKSQQKPQTQLKHRKQVKQHQDQKHVSPLILILAICQHDIWIYCFTMKTISPQNADSYMYICI